jgi:radical SAM superfamily enzyme YgiQ (UPF0313 family)
MSKNKRILITTIPGTEIAGEARVKNWPVKYTTAEECFKAANNIEYVNGFTCPNYATEFIRANIPTADILEYPGWEEYEDALKNNKYDIVGISFWTYTSSHAVKMAELARQYGVKEVWGGGHGINTPGIAKHFDRTFSGYGEFELSEILYGRPLENFKHPIMECEYDFFLNKIKTGYLFSIRGCRMTCEFCSGPLYYKRLAVTPIEEVERVLDIYRERGVVHISIVDEFFLQNNEHARKVLYAIHKRGMTFSATSRADVFIGKIKELRHFGMRSVYTGIESLNLLSLDSVRKGTNPNHVIRLFKELVENESFAFATYMIGFEHDTVENVKENIEKLKAIEGLFAVQFWIVTPFPGSVFYDRLDRDGLIVNKNWEDYDAVHLTWKHPTLKPEETLDLMKYAVRNHCHPLNIRKQKVLRAWDKFERQAREENKNLEHGTWNEGVKKELKNEPGINISKRNLIL